MTRKWTIGILITIGVFLIAWDIWVLIEPTEGDTISAVTLEFAQRHIIIPFAVGVICGHLFWPQRLKERS